MGLGRFLLRQVHTMQHKLDSNTLLLTKAFVNGNWVNAKSGNVFDVINPSNGEVICSVPDMDASDTKEVIQAAYDAFESWSETTAKERSALLRNWFNILTKNESELVNLISAEAGKPKAEACGEVAYGNGFIEWFSEEARRIYGQVVPSPVKTKEMILSKQPIGVAALVTPWNFPLAMITRKAGAALAAGCTCIVKPAEDTPLSALALAQLADEAGFPKGVFNVITSSKQNTPAVGKFLCESPLVAGISFTGSTAVGKLLYKQCATGIKRISLELGGNAPFIVFSSADIDSAVVGATFSKFRNCGQACISTNRFFIQEEVYDEFIQKFTEKIKEYRLGDAQDPNVTLGPIINNAQINKIQELVADAVSKGAKVHIGGRVASALGERFYEPTLLTNVNSSMRCYQEEVFGPVASCMKFKEEHEAVALANDSAGGLAGYFYSKDLAQIRRVAKKLQVGIVGINEGLVSSVEAAFGGVKESGIGREGSHYGIDEYTYVKYMCLGNL